MCVQDNYGIKDKPTTSDKISKNIKLSVTNDMFRSFDLKNEINYENIQKQEDNPLD
jgi:hypothetical protein